VPTIRHATSRGAGFLRAGLVLRAGSLLPAVFGVWAAGLCLCGAARPAAAAPHIVAQTALVRVPGEIVAWRDSTWFAVGRDSVGTPRFVRGTRGGGSAWSCPLGPKGGGEFAGLSPDFNKILVTAADSLGRRSVPRHAACAGRPPPAGRQARPGARALRRPRAQAPWPKPLTPVTDPDPHVSSARTAADSLRHPDDALGVPSLFVFRLAGDRPHLFLRGQKPLLSPRTTRWFRRRDTTRKVTAKDFEAYSPVGLDDLAAGDFAGSRRFARVPNRGGWSPDGQRVAFLAYGADTAARPSASCTSFARGQTTRSLPLVGDSGRPIATTTRTWRPPRSPRAGSPWPALRPGRPATTRAGSATPCPAATTPPRSRPATARGAAPLWIDRRTFVIADGAGAEPDAAIGNTGSWRSRTDTRNDGLSLPALPSRLIIVQPI
jgi:hypothetical protein